MWGEDENEATELYILIRQEQQYLSTSAAYARAKARSGQGDSVIRPALGSVKAGCLSCQATV